MINLEDVLKIINELGGTGATDDYTKGYDEAIDLIESEVCKLPLVDLTHDDICIIAMSLGMLHNSRIISAETLSNLMLKINDLNRILSK